MREAWEVLRWYRDLLAGDAGLLGIAAWSFLALAGIAGYAVVNHPTAPLAWVAFILLVVPALATAIPWIVITFRATDRSAIDWGDRLWLTVVLVIGGSLIGGIGNIADGRYVFGATALLFGGASLSLLIRHVRKPVRPPEPPQPNPGGWDEPPARGWRMFR